MVEYTKDRIAGKSLLRRFRDLYDYVNGKVVGIETVANEALSKASIAESNVNVAITQANEAVATANATIDDAQNAVVKANDAVQIANTANAKATTADSNASNANAKADDAVSKATTAESDASEALTNANNAIAKATTAESDASEALTTAQNAETVANGVDAKATQALDAVEQLEAEVGNKVNEVSVENNMILVADPTGTETYKVVDTVSGAVDANNNLVVNVNGIESESIPLPAGGGASWTTVTLTQLPSVPNGALVRFRFARAYYTTVAGYDGAQSTVGATFATMKASISNKALTSATNNDVTGFVVTKNSYAQCVCVGLSNATFTYFSTTFNVKCAIYAKIGWEASTLYLFAVPFATATSNNNYGFPTVLLASNEAPTTSAISNSYVTVEYLE